MIDILHCLSNRRLSLFLLAIVCFPLSLFAQPLQPNKKDFTFSWGQGYGRVKGHFNIAYLGDEEDGYTQVSSQRRRTLTFQHFNKDLKMDTTGSIDISEMPKDAEVITVEKLGKKYYWFYSRTDMNTQTERLLVQQLDVRHAQTIGDAKELVSTGKILEVPTRFNRKKILLFNQKKWNLYYSLDSSKVLVQYRRKTGAAGENSTIGLVLFDSDMNKLWEKDVRMPYDEMSMGYEDYVIDKVGNVYTVAKLYRDKVRKAANYSLMILKWSKDEDKAKEIVLSEKEKFVNNAKLMKDPKGNLKVAGCYSNRQGGAGTDGVLIKRLDEQTGELSNIKQGVYQFPMHVVKEFETSRALRRSGRKDDEGFNSMDIIDVVMQPEGSITIIGEEHTEQIKHGPGDINSRYQDVLVVHIAASGELKWVTKVAKDQSSEYGLYDQSIQQMSHNGNTYIIFMDAAKNLVLEPNKAPKQYDGEKRALLAVKIDKDGKQERSLVVDLPQMETRFFITESRIVTPNKLLLVGHSYSQEERAYMTFR